MKFKVIIPARYASTRLPGKVLLDVGGKSIVQRVYERACESAAEQVIIATDNKKIESVALGFGASVAMTSEQHESGTDRLQEVVEQLGLEEDEIVVNVQGDEPLIPSAVIDQVAMNLDKSRDASVSTLCEPIDSMEQLLDQNTVKCVFDHLGYALYFSRAPIPYNRDWGLDWSGANRNTKEITSLKPPEGVSYYRHIGIYAYRVGLLNRFVKWPVSPLEACERLEQLRAMANGERVTVEVCKTDIPPGIDTEEDLQRVRALFE